LEKIHIAVLEVKRIQEDIKRADELVRQGQPIKAKAYLEKVKDSEFLTEENRRQIAERIAKLDSQLDEGKKEIAELYRKSVAFYQAGQLEKAREGFIKVAKNGLLTVPAGQTAEDYLVKIDNVLVERVKPPRPTKAKEVKRIRGTGIVEKTPKTSITVVGGKLLNVAEPVQKAGLPVIQEPDKSAMVAVAKPVEPVTNKGDHKTNVIRSYTRAVFNNAVTKSQNYISQCEFDEAKEVVEMAERIVNKNRLRLGNELFGQYSSELKQLTERIIREKARWLGNWEDKGAWK